ncbi:hypothetical protein [Oligoflexus tunisiensis]|uniref:hypothetical protein n=1 Tax=Oligoflexus tunisiensis TaxID=708132 RepID=UPI00114C8B5F|nr:hypothetical protein [Oligoflexus tunisiensis]
MSVDKIVISDPLHEQFRIWLSEQMSAKGLTAEPAYIFKGFETIFLPYRADELEICFTHNQKMESNNVRFSDGKITFFLTDYLAFHSNDPSIDPSHILRSQKLEDGVTTALGLFDENILHAIGTRQLPNIPSCIDLKKIAELKLQPFLQNLGFSGSEVSAYDVAKKYVFKKGDIELILTTAGRLDDGYVGIKTPSGFYNYDDLVKKISSESETAGHLVSRWAEGGLYLGDYYRVSNLIKRTLPEILEKVLPSFSKT